MIDNPDQAIGLNTDSESESESGLIQSPVTGFLKLAIGRPVTTAELKTLDESCSASCVAILIAQAG